MSLEKADVKIGVTHELGCKFDDVLESAKVELAKNEGAAVGLFQTVKLVEALASHVDKDMDDGMYDDVVAKHIKTYIQRSAAVVHNMALKADNQRFISQGRIQAIEAVIGITKKTHDTELLKKEQIQLVEANRAMGIEPERRIPGTHPGPTMKQQRVEKEQPTEDKPKKASRSKRAKSNEQNSR